MSEQSARVEGSALMIARRAARARVETRAPTRSMVGAAHRFRRFLDAVFLRLPGMRTVFLDMFAFQGSPAWAGTRQQLGSSGVGTQGAV